MRNKQYNLQRELPKEVRLSVYKEALALYEENKQGKYSRTKDDSFGLCILLPCVLWHLKHYLDDDPNDMSWNFTNTTTAFSELAPYILNQDSVWDNKDRIEILKEIITNFK